MIKEKSMIITNDGKYHLYNYENEAELEEMIVEHYKEIFGKDSYFYKKFKINTKAGFGTIPDGYVIDFDEKKLYVIEVELIGHNLRTHISPQIVNFIQALNYEKTYDKFVEKFYEKLPQNKKITKDELRLIVSNWSIVILIDNLGDPMKEINPLLETVSFLSDNFKKEVKTIPFQTYTKENKYSKDHVHSFKAFTKEELEKESKKWTFKWTTVSTKERLKKLDENIKEVFKEIGGRICCISDNIKEVHPKAGYTTYQLSSHKNFCAIKFPKGCLEIHLKVDKDKFVDKKNMTKDVERTSNWTFDKVFVVKSKDDVDYAISLIKQAYQFMCEYKK